MQTPDVGSVDEFIASFYQGASLDSQGVFTVDLEQRSRKLQKYQLAQPEHFVLAMVRAASLSGASSIGFYREPTHLELRFDGQPFTHQELQAVGQRLRSSAVDSGSGRLQGLGYGLLLAANLPHGGLRLRSGKSALQRLGKNWVVEEIAEVTESSLRVERSGWELVLPGRLAKTYRAAAGLLEARCRFGPPRINLAERFEFEPTESALLINAGPPIPWSEPRQCLGRALFPQQPDCHGWVSLGGERRQVVLVVAGVAEVLQTVPHSNYGYQAVLWCDSLHTDLGGDKLVHNEVFLRLLRMLVLWLLQLELQQVAEFYARFGMGALLSNEAAKATLWGLRQQVLLAMDPVRVEWLKRPGHSLPVDLGAAAQAYSAHGWLAIAAEAEGEMSLDDGTEVFFPQSETAPLLELVFPYQREFFNCFGRAVPRELSLRTVNQDGLFRRHSKLFYDALVGENWAGPGQTWIFVDGRLDDVCDPDPRLPAGTTLVQFARVPLKDEEIQRLLRSLYGESECR